MAIVFFGTPEFAVPSLKALIDSKEDIALVVTQPDRVKGRGHILSLPPVKEMALSMGLKVIQPLKIRDEGFYNELITINPEFIVVVAFGRILPKEILKIPERGCINVHASLLPKYRGAAPIQWALIRGEKDTGITTMLMDEGLDMGDMLLQEKVVIQDDDNGETLSKRLSEVGARVLIKTIRGMRAGEIAPRHQTGEPSYAPLLKKEDGRIDWRKTSAELFNFIRGTYPWPGAFCYLQKERIRIIKARPLSHSLDRGFSIQDSMPGRIVKAAKGELIIETGRGLLLIEELQPEGKKIMSADAFLAGRRIEEGHEKFS